MAINYNLKGEKDNRQVVKTIDIHEESYDAIKKMIASGQNMTEDVIAPLLDDAYKMFGGNCYRTTVSIAISTLLLDIVRGLEREKRLSKDGDEAYNEILESIFPAMCYIKDEDGSAFDELRFFYPDADKIIQEVGGCLEKHTREIFSKLLIDSASECKEPAGEIAFAILLRISINDSAIVQSGENEKAN